MTQAKLLLSSVAAISLAACLAAVSPALAETVTFKANLKSSAEVPPNDSAATGAVTATYDTGSKKLTWEGSYSGLSGPATAGHLHGPADPDKTAGVVIPIADAKSSTFKGSAELTDAQAADLMAGKWYVNIHTDAHKGGEIRGQLTK
jgi:CHRD domain